MTLVPLLLLIPALAVTAARLLEPSGGIWVRLVSFTPHVLVLYVAAFLVLLGGFVAGSRGPLRQVACVLVLVLAGLHAWWAAPAFVGDPPAAGEGRLSVLSVNLSLGQADPARVVSLAAANHADVVVVSEITRVALGQLQAAGLDEAYPHTVGSPAPGPAGTMVFSRYPLRAVRPLGTSYHGYTMTAAVPSASVRLLAVHPSPPVGDAAAWRRDQAVLRQAATRDAGVPTLVVGDLNATVDHAPLRELFARGFADAAEQASSGWQPTWPAAGEVGAFGASVPSLIAIDHVLVDEQLTTVSTSTASVPGTDHRALVASVATVAPSS
ncbi:MAG TPA: endonuclease/exonuclease/phosphatase family protein [Nocardioidaceae bacterium]|nr:endonuclease/exonuclease/phosphatase family protein [Nocardioidaceae bacterium]